MKKLVIFDLDGTLAESKSSLDGEMAVLLGNLISKIKVAVISGGDWPQFEKQLLSQLPENENLNNLSILPTCGTKFYEYSNGWIKKYSENLSPGEKQKIIDAFGEVTKALNFKINETWGDVIEDRDSQITFSALGQKADLEEKEKWDPDFEKRKKMKVLLDDLLPEFSVKLGGSTSVDVTRIGVDKAYGIKKLKEILSININEMLFVGDALFPGGNDYPAKELGVTSIQVKNVEETKKIIEAINSFL